VLPSNPGNCSRWWEGAQKCSSKRLELMGANPSYRFMHTEEYGRGKLSTAHRFSNGFDGDRRTRRPYFPGAGVRKECTSPHGRGFSFSQTALKVRGPRSDCVAGAHSVAPTARRGLGRRSTNKGPASGFEEIRNAVARMDSASGLRNRPREVQLRCTCEEWPRR